MLAGAGLSGDAQATPLAPPSAARRGDILDARDFGAIGDGRADDGPALQRFLDEVVRGGRHGYIPSGHYRITAPLRVGDDTPRRYRGFTIEGAGRGAPEANGGVAGGAVIVLDAAAPADSVLRWAGNAARDARLTGIGLAAARVDGARYGLLIESSEVSHLAFDHLHIQDVTTALGLLRGTGANGEFCGWSDIQTWNVRNFFFSDAGQAYGLRFRDSFCYYREGGTLFRLDTAVVGGGVRLINFDASPVRAGAKAPASRAETTLFALAGNHNAPITVIGGRFEHITTLVEIDAAALNIIVHNQIQFIGSDFTTDLDRAGVDAAGATIRLHRTALADLHFLGCSFATAQPRRADMMIAITADRGCRGSIRFEQCGFWGYAQKPRVAGPVGTAWRLSWQDCTFNETGHDDAPAADPGSLMNGSRFDRRLGDPAPDAPVIGNLLLRSGVIAGPTATCAAAPWRHRGSATFVDTAAQDGQQTMLALAPGSGIYQDVPAPKALHYRAVFGDLTAGAALHLTLTDVASGRVRDELVITGGDQAGEIAVRLEAFGASPATYRIALDNAGDDTLVFAVSRQQASGHRDAAFVATADQAIVAGEDDAAGSASV